MLLVNLGINLTLACSYLTSIITFFLDTPAFLRVTMFWIRHNNSIISAKSNGDEEIER